MEAAAVAEIAEITLQTTKPSFEGKFKDGCLYKLTSLSLKVHIKPHNPKNT